MLNRLSLSLFGSPQVVLSNIYLEDFRTRKVQALLFFLALESGSHRREALLNLLWPGLPEKSARSNLRQILYYLRQAIPEVSGNGRSDLPLIIANRQDIRLNPEADVQIDVQQFEELLDQTQSHDHLDIYLCQTCRQTLEEALSLYQGELLANFFIEDSIKYEAWIQTRREYFRRQALDSFSILATIATRLQDYSAAQNFAEKQLEIDNLREGAYRQLMAINALTGRREQSLAIYETCRRRLLEELGMEPSQRTTVYYEKIIAGDFQFDRFSTDGVRGFELKEQIGEGAYGSIYRAVQPSVQREVAIKVIRQRYANDPEFILRFDSEAQMVARLEHPYIVPLYDYWRDPGGAYLVMRYMRGGSLLNTLENGAWNIRNAADMLEQIAGGLTFAHRQGVVHRDIKPANILLDEAGNAYLADFGIAKDLKREQQTANRKVLGTLDYVSPEQITGSELTPQTDIYSLGAVLYETLTGEKPFSDASVAELLYNHLHEPIPLVTATRPDIAPDIDAVLQKATAKLPEERFVSVLEMATVFRSAVDGRRFEEQKRSEKRLVAKIEAYNPYKGLYAFQESDADDFFGREALVQQLTDHLRTTSQPLSGRFLAVVGPSGSGKSSVVKAGLIPALRREALPQSHKWFITEMVPGHNPLEELELALWRIAVDPPPNLIEPMQRDTGGILRTLRRILPKHQRSNHNQPQLLLIIDQFEELFTLVEDDAQRIFFLDSLLHAITAFRSPLRVIITLRADFYDRPLQHAQWGQLIKQHTEVVLPLSYAGLTWAIQEPAQRMGVRFEEGLAATIVADMADQPGTLPLFQYALTELFERRAGRQITHSSYQQLGGVLGALGRRAEMLFNQLDPANQDMARQIFLRLITLGEGSEDTRRRVLQAELEALGKGSGSQLDNLHVVLGQFGDARFLTFDHDPLTRSPTVEVAHEALIREWSRLRTWLSESRSDVRLQRLLAQSASEWITADKHPGFLLRDARLDQFTSWVDGSPITLTANEQAYLAASLTARTARRSAEEERQRRELEAAQQLGMTERQRAEEQTYAAQSLRQRAYFLVGALVMAAGLALAAFSFARSSITNANLAVTRAAEAQLNANIAATSEAEAVANAALAADREAEAETQRELALAEAEVRATAEADARHNEALARDQLALATSRELALAANANLDLNPERSLLLGLEALSRAYTVEAEEVVRASLQRSRVELTLTQPGEEYWWIAFHPTGNWLAGAGAEGITIWNAQSGARLHTLSTENTQFVRNGDLQISPDGNLLAVTSENKIFLLDTNTWTWLEVLDEHTDYIDSFDFTPDSRFLASGSVHGELILWDLATSEPVYNIMANLGGTFGGYVDDVRFSPDGTLLATAGDDLTVRLWDAATGAELARIEHEGRWVNNVAFNEDGSRLLSIPLGNSRRDVYVWDVETLLDGGPIEPLEIWENIHGSLITQLDLSHDGRYFATASQDATVKVWDANSLEGKSSVTLVGHAANVSHIAFSPDSQHIATQSVGEVRIWNISPEGAGEILNISHDSQPIAFLPLSNNLVSSSASGLIYVWDFETGGLLESFDTELSNRRPAIHISQDGQWLARGGENNVLGVWELSTKQLVFTRTAHGPGIFGGIFAGIIDVEFSPDGTLLASGGADGMVRLWDAADGDLLKEWRADPRHSFFWGGEGKLPNSVANVTFSPDGRWLAASTDETAGKGGIIKIWELNSGEEILTIEDSSRRLWGLYFNADGTQISGSGSGGVMGIWDAVTGEQLALLEGSIFTVNRVIFSPDGQRLYATIPQVAVYDANNYEFLYQFRTSSGFPVISADGHYLVTRGENGIQVYTLDFEEMLAIAQTRVSRELTQAECREYLHADRCP